MLSLRQLLRLHPLGNGRRLHYVGRTLDRISLKTDITGSVDRTAEQSVKVGDTGVTTTRLALVGHADIAGHLVEVNSADGFLDEKTPVIVTRITNGTIFVQRNSD